MFEPIIAEHMTASLQDIWPLLEVVVFPLFFSMFGGMWWWLKKLDERQFSMLREMATRDDLKDMEIRINQHLCLIDNRLSRHQEGEYLNG